jgi:hypothetical protein
MTRSMRPRYSRVRIAPGFRTIVSVAWRGVCDFFVHVRGLMCRSTHNANYRGPDPFSTVFLLGEWVERVAVPLDPRRVLGGPKFGARLKPPQNTAQASFS